MPSDASAIDARVVRALAHPTRVRILSVLQERDLVSPIELATELGIALGTVGYHVRRLETLGFIELAKQTQRRGAVEHHYRARAAFVGATPPAPANGGSGRGGEAARYVHEGQDALGRGGFDGVAARADRCVVTLDAPGRARLSAAIDGWLATVERVERASARRLARNGDAATTRTCTAVVMCFDDAAEALS